MPMKIRTLPMKILTFIYSGFSWALSLKGRFIMELKEGLITLRDLSVWFGLKPDTITKSTKTAREKKLQKLHLFCDYHMEGKKIYIDKVFIPEYTKALDVFEEKFCDEWGYIVDKSTHSMSWQYEAKVDTCARVAKAIRYKYPEARQVAENTAAKYTNKVKINLYGTSCYEKVGPKGYSKIVYLNENEDGLLSDEQMGILRQCREEAYADINEQRYKLDESWAIGEISRKEYKEAQGNIDTSKAYHKFEELMYERLGFIPTRRTQLVDKP